jgi:nifR3 family TIM-barrel protein
VNIPVTIKIRTGWDASGTQALELAHIAQECGVDAIAVHPRTARQGFSGNADWDLIARVKDQSDIPIIGNGDINSADDALRMFKETGCDAVMIGRGAIGNLFIFHQINELLAGQPLPAINVARRFDIMRRYLRASVQYLGENRACPMMRSRLGWFSKGLPQASRFRHAVRQVASESEALKLIDAFEGQLIADEVHGSSPI